MELQKELVKQTELELSSTFVFDYPSIAEMHAFLLANLPLPKAVPTTAAEVAPGKDVAAKHGSVHATLEDTLDSSNHKARTENEPIWLRMNDEQRKGHMQQQVNISMRLFSRNTNIAEVSMALAILLDWMLECL